MGKIPFSVYDFFAYLSSGTVVLATVDYIWGLGILERKEVGTVLGIVLVILAYVTGHIVAQFSSFLFEHTIVKRILQRPLALLLGDEAALDSLRWIFPNFHTPFPEHTRHRIKNRPLRDSCPLKGKGYSFTPILSLLQTRKRKLDWMIFATSMASLVTCHLPSWLPRLRSL